MQPQKQLLDPTVDEAPMGAAECLQRIAIGEEHALGALYDQLGGLLFSLARRITGNDRESEEIVQDVFMTVWRNARTFDGKRASPTTWLTTITRNKAIDRLRSSHRRLPPAPENVIFIGDIADTASNPLEEVYTSDRAKCIAAWMNELPKNQRQALELAFFEGLTHPEIASRLDETIGTVKSRIRVGLDRLRQNCRFAGSQSTAQFDVSLPLAVS